MQADLFLIQSADMSKPHIHEYPAAIISLNNGPAVAVRASENHY